MRKFFGISLSLILLILNTNLLANEKKEMLFYIGITMIKPVNVLAKKFEKKHNCSIKILQGGSQDLYESAKMSKEGDLYLPGSLSYRKKYLKEGNLLDGKFVGYNKLSLVVKKGNPKNIPANISTIVDDRYRIVLGNEESGSVGNATKKMLMPLGMYEEAIMKALYLSPDSRNLTKLIKDDKVDIIINWYATTFWEENKGLVEPIVLSSKIAKKKKLVFNLLKSSKYPKLAKQFMDYAASKEGRKIFYKYGFLDDKDLKNFDKVTF